MLKSILVMAIALQSICVVAQKKIISTDSFKKWPTLGFLSVSSDGKYASYFIHNNVDNVDSLIIQSTDNKWRVYAINGQFPKFSDDGKRVFYTSSDNRIVEQYLGKKEKQTIDDIDIIKNEGPVRQWLLGIKNDKPTTLIAYNIYSRKTFAYADVTHIHLTDKEYILLLERRSNNNGTDVASLEKLDLSRNVKSIIWEGNSIGSVLINNPGNQLAFVGEDGPEKRVFLYDLNKPELKSVYIQNLPEKGDGFSLGGIQSFNRESGLFLTMSKKPSLNLDNDSVKLNIWSYTDKKLQCLQLSELDRPDEYTLFVDFISGKSCKVSTGDERLTVVNDKCALVTSNNDTISLPSFKIPWVHHYLQFFDDGRRIKVPRTLFGDVRVSPDGQFLVYYNLSDSCYYSYEVKTNKCRNIIQGISPQWAPYYFEADRGVAGWASEDNAVYIYDRFDIWRLDLFARKPALNITNGFGWKHNIVFGRIVESEYNTIIPSHARELLLAFNKKTKENGFFWTSTSSAKDPTLASMGAYIYDISKFGRGLTIVGPGNNMIPVKAAKANKYIVQRASADSHFNYYSTTDFKSFQQLSFLQPQKQFNWYTAELHTWKSLNGDSIQGILYKPENFDSTKKYPLVYLVYDDKSDGLNSYWRPEFAWNGTVSIPYLVSHGYLVFAPDFMIKPGEIGKNLTDATLSSFEYLKQFSFIDPARIGINGYSFGGFNTYYLITNTNIFAAAVSGGGVTDLISTFGRIKGGRAEQLGGHQSMLGGHTPWNSTKLIEYNPIFKVDNLQAPVLMLHNKQDGAVDFSQAIEFYTAARGLGKRAWLLEYEGQGHAVGGPAAVDFTSRLMQFFDHYLKGEPAPLWMLDGRPARLRGIDDRLQLDTLGRAPQFSH